MSRLVLCAGLLSALALAAPAGAGVSISGHVQIPPGLAPEEVQVQLLPVISPYEQGVLTLERRLLPDAAGAARPDRRGDFKLVADHAGMWRVRVSAPGYLARELDLEPLTEPTRLPPLQLERGAPVEIRVTDGAGKPVAHALVTAEPSPEHPPSLRFAWRDAGRIALTDDAGRAVLHRSSSERFQVRAFATSYQESQSQAAGPGILRLRLEPASRRLILQVRTTQGRPAPDSLIRCNGWPAGRTDETGQFQLAIPKGVSFDLVAQTREGLRASNRWEIGEVRDHDRPLVLTLPEATEIRGRVLDAKARTPLAGALVWSSERSSPWVETDATGAYALPLAASGQRSLSAAAQGYFPAKVPVVGGSGASTTIALYRSARLRGVVRNRAGEPVPGARISARASFGGDPGGFGIALQNPPGHALAQADGSFVLSGLVPGLRYSLWAEAVGYAGTREAVVLEESAREKAGVEIVLSVGSSAFGRVIDSAGEPVAGAKLLLQSSPASEPPSLATLGGTDAVEPLGSESLSGSEGEFRVENLTPGTYDLEVRAPGFATKQIPAVEIAATPTELGEIALEPGATIQGRVVSRQGRPIAGATVSAWLQNGDPDSDGTATTSADGAFRLDDLSAGSGFDLTVTRKGYAEKLVPGVRVPTVQALEIVIEEAARISGRVLGADRQPLENATVAIEPQASLAPESGNFLRGPGPASGRTDSAGLFDLEDVPPGPLRLSVAAEGWKPKELEGLEIGPGESIRDLEIVLERGAAIAGRVLDAQGRPASEAFLAVQDPGGRTNVSAQTDGDGRYRLEGVEPGLRQVEVRWSGRNLTRELEVAPGENSLDLRFEGGTQVSGRVIDSAGSPIAGAQVALVSPAGLMRMAASTETVADGTFRLADVLDGSYQLRAEAQGYATSVSDRTVEVAGAPVSGLEVQLSAGATLRGRLIGLQAEEAAGAQISAVLMTKRLFAAGIVRSDGSYEIKGLAPGDWMVSALAGGSGRTAQEPIAIGGGATEELLDLELKAGLRLTGTVLRAGQPVAGIHVSVHPLEAGSGGMATTDHEGRFEFTGLDPGPHQISVAVTSGSSQSETITLATDDDVLIEIDTSRLAGHVIDALTAQPIAGAAVSLELLDRAAGDDVPVLGSGEATDSTGFFRIEEAAGGSYRLRAEKDGYAAVELPLTVTAGIDQEGLEIRLAPNRGLLLRASYASGGAPQNLLAAVVDGEHAVQAGVFASLGDGLVRLSSVPPGEWTVLVSDPGYAVAEVRAKSPSDKPTPITLVPEALLEITVPELRDGSAQAEVRITGPNGRAFRQPSWFELTDRWRLHQGSAVIRGLPAGLWLVRVSAADGRTWEQSLSARSGAIARVKLH